MAELLKPFSVVVLDYSPLDETHRHLAEFAQHLNTANEEEFPPRFLSLLGQMEEHFADEERLMEQVDFRHTAEHKEDHRQLLTEIRQLLLRRQPFARAYVRERLPERLNLHISRMDSMLAAALKTSD